MGLLQKFVMVMMVMMIPRIATMFGMRRRFLVDPELDKLAGNCDCYESYPACDCLNGFCRFTVHNYTTHRSEHKCFCDAGWTGELCNLALNKHPTTAYCDDISVDEECSCHGVLIGPHCQCYNNWSGSDCSIAHTSPPVTNTPATSTSKPDVWKHECGSSFCIHGECYVDYNYHRYFCRCYQGWIGPHCDEEYPSTGFQPCGYYPCLHGVCQTLSTGQPYCNCYQGWGGPICDFETAPHTEKPTTHLSSTTGHTSATVPPTTEPLNGHPSTTVQANFSLSMPIESTLPISSTIIATAISHSPEVTPTTMAFNVSKCNKIELLTAIARQTTISHQASTNCSLGTMHSSEAVPLQLCPVPQNPHQWKQGYNIMSECHKGETVPDYSPIATFHNSVYSSANDISGVFLGCINSGVKMAFQGCNTTLRIENIDEHSSIADPHMFYTIS